MVMVTVCLYHHRYCCLVVPPHCPRVLWACTVCVTCCSCYQWLVTALLLSCCPLTINSFPTIARPASDCGDDITPLKIQHSRQEELAEMLHARWLHKQACTAWTWTAMQPEGCSGNGISNYKVHYTGQSNTCNSNCVASIQLCTHSTWQKGFTQGVTGNKQITLWDTTV